jgi:alkaline phosphatase D
VTVSRRRLLPDAVVIWTRLTPKPYEPLGAPYKEVG